MKHKQEDQETKTFLAGLLDENKHDLNAIGRVYERRNNIIPFRATIRMIEKDLEDPKTADKTIIEKNE